MLTSRLRASALRVNALAKSLRAHGFDNGRPFPRLAAQSRATMWFQRGNTATSSCAILGGYGGRYIHQNCLFVK